MTLPWFGGCVKEDFSERSDLEMDLVKHEFTKNTMIGGGGSSRDFHEGVICRYDFRNPKS